MLVRRLMSWLVDYVVILGWLAVLALVVGVPSVAGWWGLDRLWSDPIASDVAITVMTVVPLFGYLTVTESRPPHGTWGKRRAGLTVIAAAAPAFGTARAVVRNLVKVLPWQLGHMGAIRLAFGEAEILGMALGIGAMALGAMVVGPPLISRRGIHDVVAGSEVTPATG